MPGSKNIQNVVEKINDATETLSLFLDAATGHHSIRCSKFIPKLAVLHAFSAREYVESPTYLSVQVDDDKHILLFPEFLQYINHSCEPNTFFDTKNGEIIALREINSGEEITFFYPSTEWSMTQAFPCFCKASGCLGEIQGALHLNETAISKYRFSEHIQKRLYGKN